MSIANLSTGFPITRQAVTKHLRVMEDAGLVRNSRRGRESVWQLQQARLADVRRYLQLVSEEWDETIGRLKRYVER
jgi:DNA-binding transcriptional ArsR family regulator